MPILQPSDARNAAIVGAIAVVASFGLFLLPTSIKVCSPEGICQTFTQDEYRQVKASLLQKYLSGEPASFEEYRAFIAVLDREIKQARGLTIQNMKSDADIKNAVSALLTQP